MKIDGGQRQIKIQGGKHQRQDDAQRQLAFAHDDSFFLGNAHENASFFQITVQIKKFYPSLISV